MHKPQAPIPHEFADVAVTIRRDGPVTQAMLSLGSNLGDREAHLRERSPASGRRLVVSGVYETPPWGDPDQPRTSTPPCWPSTRAATRTAGWTGPRRLEQAAGRVRDPDRRFGPRTLDVDVIAVWDDDGAPVTVDDPELTLPHPRAHLRAFVLRPWLDIQPYAQLPGHGWLYDLVRADPVAADLADLRPRDDIHLDLTGAERWRRRHPTTRTRPVRPMEPTSPATLVIAALAATALSWIGISNFWNSCRRCPGCRR